MAKSPKTYNSRPMAVASEFNSGVDIIVPFHGQYEKVMNLLDGLFRLTRSNYYKLCLVDDASPNSSYIESLEANARKNADRLRSENVVLCLRNDEQLGFGGACRAGFEATSNPYVCFVQSDCAIEDSGWLRKMGETLLRLKPQGVRMVSAMTDNPVGGDPAQKGEKFARSSEDVVLGDDSFLSLYCFMCHRELFNRCGGFLKEYPYACYEDEEIAGRMKKHGFKQAVCRSSWVRHEGQATVREICRGHPEIKDIMAEDNRLRCIEDLKRLG